MSSDFVLQLPARRLHPADQGGVHQMDDGTFVVTCPLRGGGCGWIHPDRQDTEDEAFEQKFFHMIVRHQQRVLP